MPSSLYSITIDLLYSILTFLLLFSQATLFNRIFNHHKVLPKPTYLPGMSYILITSLLPDWDHFSAPLLINTIMIWVWYRMMDLYNSQRPGTAIFNIGIWTGHRLPAVYPGHELSAAGPVRAAHHAPLPDPRMAGRTAGVHLSLLFPVPHPLPVRTMELGGYRPSRSSSTCPPSPLPSGSPWAWPGSSSLLLSAVIMSKKTSANS